MNLGSIPFSTLHVDYVSTLLDLADNSYKKGPNILGKCRTILSSELIWNRWIIFFPRIIPRNIN